MAPSGMIVPNSCCFVDATLRRDIRSGKITRQVEGEFLNYSGVASLPGCRLNRPSSDRGVPPVGAAICFTPLSLCHRPFIPRTIFGSTHMANATNQANRTRKPTG